MAHWTDYIKLDETVKVANQLGIETDSIGKRDLIETIMLLLMGQGPGHRPLIREPWFINSPGYDQAVRFYHQCHSAVRNLTASLSCLDREA